VAPTDGGSSADGRWVVDAMAWRERLGFEGGEESADSELLRESFEAAGAYVMGRRMASSPPRR
jgi:hypothetical protein